MKRERLTDAEANAISEALDRACRPSEARPVAETRFAPEKCTVCGDTYMTFTCERCDVQPAGGR